MWFIVRRGIVMVAILFVLSAVLFGLLSLMPGNPVDMLITSNPHIKAEDVMRLKKLRGLDQPWYVQYFRWLWGYAEPARPPQILPIDAIFLDKASVAPLHIDLSQKLVDPNFVPSPQLMKEMLDELWQDWPQSPLHEAIDHALGTGDSGGLLELALLYDPKLEEALQEGFERHSTEKLRVQGLFGTTSEGLILTAPSRPEQGALWFVVRNDYGQEKVGSIAVFNAPHQALLRPLGTQRLEDEHKPFKLDLKNFMIDKEKNGTLSFKLITPDEGSLSADGVYERRFEHAGQSMVQVAVKDAKNNEQMLAFDIEHGVLGREDKFNGGFLFVFKGDTNALGFSETYKRPVYDLLFGTPRVCGDGKVDEGESCDPGLRSESSCDAHCFKSSDTWASKIDKRVSAWIVNSGRIGNTLQLMLPAFLISLLFALPLGIYSAYRQYSWLDYFLNFGAFVGISLPVFWFGIMMIYVFAEEWPLFPAGGAQTPGIYEEGMAAVILDRVYHAFLPITVLSIFYVGRWLRYVRASMLEVLPEDYIRTARAKGLAEKKVVLKHAFRNALIPVVTVLALSIPSLFGGAVLTETVFSWPGIGRLQYEAVMNNDYYVAIIVFLLSAFLVMVGNLAADILYVLVDPRLRKGRDYE